MRRAALPSAALLVLLGATASQAEDFTGFYAGLNAGYAMNRDGKGHRGSLATAPDAGSGATADGLPPSAASAAKLMQDRRTGADAKAAR